MPSNIPTPQSELHFKSMLLLARFKKECECSDFYIDQDQKKIVGTFSKKQIELATEKYQAVLTNTVQ